MAILNVTKKGWHQEPLQFISFLIIKDNINKNTSKNTNNYKLLKFTVLLIVSFYGKK